MIRYCQQYAKTDCGPTAVLNALKWAGYGHTLRKGYRAIRTKCKWSREHGSYSGDVAEVLKRYKQIKTKKVIKPTLKRLEQHLQQGGSFILRYTHNDGKEGHFSFCFGADDKFFHFYNDSSLSSKRRRTRKKVQAYLRKLYFNDGRYAPAVAMLISKK